MSSDEMRIVKRDGTIEVVSFDKILRRIKNIGSGGPVGSGGTVGSLEPIKINYTQLTMKIIDQLYDKISTTKIDELTADQCASMSSIHYDYGTLASRIIVSNCHKNTDADFVTVAKKMYNYKDKHGVNAPLITRELLDFTKLHSKAIKARINYDRDFLFDYFGFKTLERSYLMRVNNVIVERPQHMWMRVALSIHKDDIEAALDTYDLMSQKYFTHATPTLFNAGTPRPQLSSCFIAGTDVHTMRGVVPIESVRVGDEVVSHTGNVQKVVQLHKNLLGNRKLFNIKVAGSPTLTVTNNHRLWSLSDEQEKWGQKPTWNTVEYLRTGDWISIPNKKIKTEDYIFDVKCILDNIDGDGYNIKYKYVYGDDNKVYTTSQYVLRKKSGDYNCEKNMQPFNRYWIFDNEFMELIGMWYGDGCITNGKNSHGIISPHSVSIVAYHTNAELIKFVKRTFSSKLGITSLSVSTDHNGMVQMTVHSKIIARIFKQVFGSKFSGKQIPDFFNKFSYEHIRYFLAGLASTDGCLTLLGTIQVQLTNPPLMTSIFHLARSVGIPVTLTLMHKMNCNATGRMQIPHALLTGLLKKFYNDNRLLCMDKDKKSWNCVKVIDGVTFMRLNEKYLSEHACEYVYTFGVENDHSYSVGGIIAENCFLIAMEEDSIEGIFNTLKDCALISKWAGGIGLHIHNIRASNSHIRGTNGSSNGIVPMLRVFNNTAKYVDQCLDPETIVYTKRGPVKIKNIIIGDEVITDDGNCYNIRKVLDYPEYKGDLHTIDVKHSLFPLKLTDMHPLWVIKNKKYVQTYFNDIIADLDKGLIAPDFVEAKNVDRNDFVGFPIPKWEQDIPQFTEDDCRMYGILIGDGNISRTNNLCYVSLSTETKQDIIEFVEGYLKTLGIHITYSHNHNNVRLVFSRTTMFKFTYEMVYDENKDKRILPNMLHLPKNKTLSIIKGILETDAKISNHQISLEMTSFNVVESVRYMLLRLGILSSGSVRNRAGQTHVTVHGKTITNKKPTMTLLIPKKEIICKLFPNKNLECSKKLKFFEYKGYLFSIVNSNQNTENYSGRVIDIEVDNKDHHNFLTHNGLVKNGGGKRNGSFAIYLEPWHADIELFLDMRKNHGDEELKARDLFYALWIPDLFMERVKTDGTWTLLCPDECPGLADVYGDAFAELYTKYENDTTKTYKCRKTVKARELWFKVLDAQMETGTPYLCYKDAANKKSNQSNLGVIKSSNLCVAPETLILTDKGHIEISSLENQKVNVWNGEEYSEVEVKKTGENQRLIEVHADDGSILTCTPYHKFYIQTSFARSKILQIEAQNLKPGNKIIKCEYPIIDGTSKMLYPYMHGFFCGDGTYGNTKDHEPTKCNFKSVEHKFFCNRHLYYETEHNNLKTYPDNVYCNALSYDRKPKIFLYGDKKKLLKYMNYRTITENDNRISIDLPMDIEEKFYVPSNNTLADKLEWFAGYCDADGTISKNGENQQLQVASINKEFLLKVKLMLQTCGINPKVRKNKEKGTSLLPDGKGGQKLFDTKEIYRLLITSIDLRVLVNAGFSPKRLIINTENILQRSASQFVKIDKIVNNERIDNTFCFTEPKRNMGVFNGILTGQCSEIMEYSDANETAVCNLASIGLPTFVSNGVFDYAKLHEVSQTVTRNLNKVIDINYYPTEKTRVSNMRHRPIGIGVQGLADVFMLLDVPFHSDKAKEINQTIFETIYHGALTASADAAEKDGPYETFGGSPASKGILQYDMWNTEPKYTNNTRDWSALKERIQKVGLRNSLLLAPMPTASTSQILGFNECFEPFTSNIYSRRTMAGEFMLTNKYLMRDLIDAGLWNTDLKNSIVGNQGSVQHIEGISQHLKDKYKTVWEIPMKHVIDMAADRGAFICQSQSLNLWLEDPNYNMLTSMHFYGWQKGLKTGIYYLRRRAKHRAQQFTIEPERHKANDDAPCEMCSA